MRPSGSAFRYWREITNPGLPDEPIPRVAHRGQWPSLGRKLAVPPLAENVPHAGLLPVSSITRSRTVKRLAGC